VDRDAISASHRNAAANGLPFRAFLPPDELGPWTEAAGAHLTRNALSRHAEPGCVALPPGTFAATTNAAAGRGPGGCDVCVANILAGPLVQLAPTVARLTRSGGLLGLSGVLAAQGEAFCAAYRPFFPDVAVTKEREGWLLLTGTRA
jgi:ribosomal protein L11 methylase PrmA